MKIAYKQNKRDGDVTLTIRVTFYELCNLAQFLSVNKTDHPTVIEFAEKIDAISEETEEPM